jgi:hypothetical protein
MSAYPTWLLDQIAGIHHARRLASYARYRVSENGQRRTRRYNQSFAHREACRRWRETHCRGPLSYQIDAGFGRRIRWTNLMKVDPGDKAAALWETDHGRRMGGLTSAERIVSSLGHNPETLHDEQAWDTIHAHVGKSFSNEHVRQLWKKKAAATLGAR